MQATKPWWQSKTLWGALMTLAAAALGLAGIDLDDSDAEALTEMMTSLGAAIGGLVAIFGRISAKHRIG